ncbi:hypothetical protein [Paenibacillus soyae]|uniref:Uncharacterized protein n=1 Tax=Paenibacillus soyae TaxID=2969249 RepID=A0A9X2MPD8_9BACL|nr:hypothetical protein [Paenibacillus soyae]MCR2803403.1 hypothetical protein [Paenibacillus soyae]
MRMYAIGILAVLLASLILTPLVEMAIVYREKIVMDSSIRNASRVAKDRALEFEGIRDLNADIDEERFKDYFADALEDVMNLSRGSSAGNTVSFTSNDGIYNTVRVEFAFYEEDRPEGRVTEVEVRAEADYKFKTKLMRTAESLNPALDYELVTERAYVLTVKN